MVRREAQLAAVAPALVLLAAVLIHVPTLAQPLVDRHGWRQTQTAWTARVFYRDGIDLLRPEVPVLGPPWVLPFELPVFQAIAALVMRAGIPEDAALRLTGLASFAVAATLLYVLLGTIDRRLAFRFVGLVAFVASPLALLWSRSSLIEYTALAACLLFAVAGLRWRSSGLPTWWVVALAAGVLAATVKVTTALFWIAPFPLLGYGRDPRDRESGGMLIGAWLLAIVPLAAAAGWTSYGDAIKVASPDTAGLTSQALAEWNFGTLAQRLDPSEWQSALWPPINLAGGFVLPIAAAIALHGARPRGQARLWSWLAMTLAGPILLFFNLYAEHDYYAVAVSASVAALLAGAVVVLLDSTSRWARPLLLGGAVSFAATIAIFATYWAPQFRPVHDPGLVLPKAEVIRQQTQPDGLVAVVAPNWSPELLYYADRRGLMLLDWLVTPARIDDLRASGYVVFRCPSIWGPGTCTKSAEPPYSPAAATP
jgi:hypothetical protein